MPADAPPTWMIGAMIGVITALAGVVAYLFKRYERRDDRREKAMVTEREKMAGERASWDVEREKLRADYETKNAELSTEFAKALRDEHRTSRDREDVVRKEFAEIMEMIERDAKEASKEVVNVLTKFYDRFVGPRGRY